MAVPFVTAEQLETSLSPETFAQLFDDNRDGTADAAPVAEVLRRAHVRVLSRLPALYASLPADAEIPDLLWDIELAYARGLSYRRHPEYVRWNEEETKNADTMMALFQEGTLQITDDAPAGEEPGNVGGWSVDTTHRVVTQADDGSLNTGDF